MAVVQAPSPPEDLVLSDVHLNKVTENTKTGSGEVDYLRKMRFVLLFQRHRWQLNVIMQF